MAEEASDPEKPSIMNPWEACALQYNYSEAARAPATHPSQWSQPLSSGDSLIYPGIYSHSGFDIMRVLIHVETRPNPQVDIGFIDTSCALILCDLKQPDQPIIYASEAFLALTGYQASEVIGRNCRFLQSPTGAVKKQSVRKYVDKDTIKTIGKAVTQNTEVQIEVINFKKDGKKFTNLLTIIPIRLNGQDFDYSVGLQCDKDE